MICSPGTPGRLITAKDAKSNSISDDYSTSIAAQDGDSLILTINQTIQYYLEKGLRETMEQYRSRGAYGVVMDCNTGAVLAMSSMPDYDCNEPYKLTYDKNKKAIKKIKDKTKKSEAESAAVQNQWRNFTVSDTYVPGSVFKTFIASRCAGGKSGEFEHQLHLYRLHSGRRLQNELPLPRRSRYSESDPRTGELL